MGEVVEDGGVVENGWSGGGWVKWWRMGRVVKDGGSGERWVEWWRRGEVVEDG